MIEFMKSIITILTSQYVHLKYKVKLKDADKDFIFNETEADLNKFDKLLMSSSPEFCVYQYW
jgi:hypothetical protein